MYFFLNIFEEVNIIIFSHIQNKNKNETMWDME